jgi:hypothetical protein
LAVAVFTIRTEAQEQNIADKIDSYDIVVDGVKTGRVVVSARNIGEPVALPFELSIQVTCVKGYTTATPTLSNESIYDYGRSNAPTELSSFQKDKNLVTVNYWMSQVNEDLEIVRDRAFSVSFDVSRECAAKKRSVKK